MFGNISLMRAAALAGLLCVDAARVTAADPVTAVQTVAAAKKAAPGVKRAGKGLAEVPRECAQCLRLPLGLVQMVFSPLPEVTFKDGLKNTGKGLVAPFSYASPCWKCPARWSASRGMPPERDLLV